MPINVKSGEREEEFISRCIETEIKSGKEQDVAAGICYSVWRESKMSSQERMINKMNKKKQELEGACWPNYIQIGTKIVDGREVPDCRGPID